MAKADMFLKVDGIPGTSKQTPGEMDVVSWSWGMTHAVGDNGQPVGKSNVHDITIVKPLDGATPNLALQCCTHKSPIPKVVLTCFHAPDKTPYLTITLERCVITSVNLGGHGGTEEPTETLTISFGKYELKWKNVSQTYEVHPA